MNCIGIVVLDLEKTVTDLLAELVSSFLESLDYGICACWGSCGCRSDGLRCDDLKRRIVDGGDLCWCADVKNDMQYFALSTTVAD